MTKKVPTRKLWVLVIAALLIVGPLPWPVTPVMGANFTVNTTADTTDATPGDGTCADSMDQCSLRAAIQEANALAGADTISLQSGATYTLSLEAAGSPGEEDVAAEDDLDITSEITIQGNGATIQRSSSVMCNLDKTDAAGEFRIFHVQTGGNLTLQNVTVTGGCADSANIFPDDDGGGILNFGTVTITNSTISGNHAAFGGGAIFNYTGGTVTITNSTILNNIAFGGGGINATGRGRVTITNSMISGNHAAFDGGILNVVGTTTITNSTISGNRADVTGGGIGNGSDGTVTIQSSTISDNHAGIEGGGILNFGTVTIQSSTISDNHAGTDGGGILNVVGTTTITNSTISGNRAASDGGGIWNFARMTITNSTISGNSSGGASGEDGGGIWNDGTVDASFVTIANNSAGASGQGGGIFNAMGGTFNIKNSIVGNNTAPTGPNCSGTLTPTGANLATDTMTSCGTTNFAYVASTGAGGLNLGPLQVNAPGTTATHALQSGSAAIDAVTDCSDLLSQQVTDDQRGVSRPLNGDGAGMALCDAGAYEAPAQSPSPPPSNVLRLQGNGHCLEVDRDRRIYRFRAANGRVFTGPLTFTQRGSKLEFQSPRGQSPLLKGTIDLNRRTGSAALVAPLSQGGGRYVITDRSIDDNTPCP